MVTLAYRKSGLVELVAAAFARFRKRLKYTNELRALGDSETDRMAYDLGLSRPELVRLAAKGEDSADLLKRRLAENGIDIRTIAPEVLWDMQRCCAQCVSKQQCGHEIDDKPRAARWPDYCPNQQTIATFTSDIRR